MNVLPTWIARTCAWGVWVGTSSYVHFVTYGHTCRSMNFICLVKIETRDSHVIEVSALQFDLHPINAPGIAFAQLEKIGFSRWSGRQVYEIIVYTQQHVACVGKESDNQTTEGSQQKPHLLFQWRTLSMRCRERDRKWFNSEVLAPYTTLFLKPVGLSTFLFHNFHYMTCKWWNYYSG